MNSHRASKPYEAFQQSELDFPSILHVQPWMSSFPRLKAGFSTRKAGVSAQAFQSMNLSLRVGDDLQTVLKNREILSQAAGFSASAWTCAEQVHGTHIAHVSAVDRGAGRLRTADEIREADAILTQTPNLMLVSFYADCVPVYFYDAKLHVIGLAHAGWKGTYGQIASKVITEMQFTYGSDVADVFCAIGPSIGNCCYEVSEQLVEQFASRFAAVDQYVDRSSEKPKLDLKQLNFMILQDAGVPANQIELSSYCTHCRDDLFFSHRRDRGLTGRMVSWIGLV